MRGNRAFTRFIDVYIICETLDTTRNCNYLGYWWDISGQTYKFIKELMATQYRVGEEIGIFGSEKLKLSTPSKTKRAFL